MISIINDLDTKSRAQFQVRLQSRIEQKYQIFLVDLSDMNCMSDSARACPGFFKSGTDSIILGI